MSTIFNLNALKSSVVVSNEKNEIYKKEIFIGCVTKKDKTRQRGRLRDILLSYMDGFTKLENNPILLQKHFTDFNKFYSQCYVINNYEVSSVCNANMSIENKNLISQGMIIAKKCASKLTEDKEDKKK